MSEERRDYQGGRSKKEAPRQVHVRLTEGEYDRLRGLADSHFRSLSAQATYMLSERLADGPEEG